MIDPFFCKAFFLNDSIYIWTLMQENLSSGFLIMLDSKQVSISTETSKNIGLWPEAC